MYEELILEVEKAKSAYKVESFQKVKAMLKGFFSVHNHSDYSNIRLIDAIIKPHELISRGVQIGLKGVVLSDHECVSGHIKMIQSYKEKKKSGLLPDDFKIALGNEIYLVREDSIEELQTKWKKRVEHPETKYYHFLLIAKDKIGWQQLSKLSSLAWEQSFMANGMRRCPTFKSDMKRIIQGGHVLASSACLGSELSQYILRWKEAETIPNNEEKINYYKEQINSFIRYCIDVFGIDNFHLEIQPSYNPEQITVNQTMFLLAKAYGLKVITTTDSHYLKKDEQESHRIYLQSKEGDREVDDFYGTTYEMNEEEMYEYFSTHLTDEQFVTAVNNTMSIYEKVEEYDLYRQTQIPMPHIPATLPKLESELLQGQDSWEDVMEEYPYIKKFFHSNHQIDRHYLTQIALGFNKHIVNRPDFDEEYRKAVLSRINVEMKELWLISDQLDARMSQYYILTQEIVDIIWEAGSLTPAGRGSSSGYLTNYLLDITQYNPMDYGLPHFRHLNAERVGLPDVDLDSSAARRGDILDLLRERFGSRHVLNIATFGTEGSKSAIQAACRGLSIPVEDSRQISGLIPSERGQQWSLKDCFEGNEDKGRKPVTELVNLVDAYPNLKKTAMRIEGTINKSSIHASGVYIFNEEYDVANAVMRAPKGQLTTQFDQDDSDYLGGLKEDLLTVEAVDMIQECLETLVKDGLIEWQGSLRATYEKYLHPNVIDLNNDKMWDKIGKGEINSLFQFDTTVGAQTIKHTQPRTIEELATANSVMRLMSDTGESPTDKYVRFKKDSSAWQKEMDKYELTSDERMILNKYFESSSGVSIEQEQIMLLVQDSNVAGFSVSESDSLRKAVAKKKPKMLQASKELLYENAE